MASASHKAERLNCTTENITVFCSVLRYTFSFFCKMIDEISKEREREQFFENDDYRKKSREYCGGYYNIQYDPEEVGHKIVWQLDDLPPDFSIY